MNLNIDDLKDADINDLWEVYSQHGKGLKAYIIDKTAKEAIEKFEKKYCDYFGPYTVISVNYLGSVSK